MSSPFRKPDKIILSGCLHGGDASEKISFQLDLFAYIRRTGPELLAFILGMGCPGSMLFVLATIGMEQEHRRNIQAACGQLRMDCGYQSQEPG